MAVSLERKDSVENLPRTDRQDIVSSEMRESAAKAGECATKVGCGFAKIAVSAGMAAGGQATLAPVVITALDSSEKVCAEGSRQLTMSGFVDPALQKTHAMTNNCVIL